MAAFEITHVSTGLVGRIGNAFASIVATVAAWNDARVTRNALTSLTDRELDDIGLVRGDIDAVAQGLRHY